MSTWEEDDEERGGRSVEKSWKNNEERSYFIPTKKNTKVRHAHNQTQTIKKPTKHKGSQCHNPT